MPNSFERTLRLLAAAVVVAVIPLGSAAAVITPPGQHVRVAERGLFTDVAAAANFDGRRCRVRRNVCRRYPTDQRTIQCLERFGCFTGPSFY